jgi:hypothetical protein
MIFSGRNSRREPRSCQREPEHPPHVHTPPYLCTLVPVPEILDWGYRYLVPVMWFSAGRLDRTSLCDHTVLRLRAVPLALHVTLRELLLP